MKLIKFISLFLFLSLSGCYTQLALRDFQKDYDEEYSYQENYDTTVVDTEKSKEINIYNYYYGGFYPHYRRYYWGYYPGWSITIGTYYDPFWWDFYYYSYYPWWYYPYRYSYWAYVDYWYYPYWNYPYYWHYGKDKQGIYKYREIYTHLRNSDGDRGINIQDRGNSYRSGRSSINQNTNARPVDVDLSRTSISRDRDNKVNIFPKKSNDNNERKKERSETRIQYLTEITRDKDGNRSSTRERSNTSSSERKKSGSENSVSLPQPSYTPPRNDTHYSPSNSSSSRPSSGSESTRGGDGGRSSRNSGGRR